MNEQAVQRRIDEISALFRERLQGYIGTTTVTPATLLQMRNELAETVRELTPEGGFRISAGQVRAMGYEVPASIPDCATCEFRLGDPQANPVQRDRVIIPMTPVGPFEWIDLNLIVGPEGVVTQESSDAAP